MVAVLHHAPVNDAVMLLKIDRLNFDSLAGNVKNIKILCSMVS